MEPAGAEDSGRHVVDGHVRGAFQEPHGIQSQVAYICLDLI